MAILSNSKISTQDHLEIEDIRDDLIITKDGAVSLVLETTALNFELLSEGEQDARILEFAGLLNSLDFRMQIIVRTERTDVSNYIKRLQQYKVKQISKALRKQIDIYIKFVKNLTQNREVLDKSFFIVIPQMVGTVQKTSMIKQMFGKRVKIVNKKEIISKAKIKVHPKRDHLIKQFKKMGLIARQLIDDELIRLFYTSYEPDKLGIKNITLTPSELTTGLIGSNEPNL